MAKAIKRKQIETLENMEKLIYKDINDFEIKLPQSH